MVSYSWFITAASTSDVSQLINSAGALRMFFSSFTFTGVSVPSGLTLRNRLHPHEHSQIGGRRGMLSPPIIPSLRYFRKNSTPELLVSPQMIIQLQLEDGPIFEFKLIFLSIETRVILVNDAMIIRADNHNVC